MFLGFVLEILEISYLRYKNPDPELYWLDGKVEFVNKIDVWPVFYPNLHLIDVNVDYYTLQSTPSTFTDTFDLSNENPVPEIYISWPALEPYWVVLLTNGKTTNWYFSELFKEAL